MIGRRILPFEIILEVDNPAGVPSHFAIDDIRLVDCFPSEPESRALLFFNVYAQQLALI